MRLPYQKLHGCQNEYLFVDLLSAESKSLNDVDFGGLSRQYSNRESGIGSDGLILLLPPQDPSKADVRMQIFNADGSEAEMCGNGIRCLAKVFHEHHREKSDTKPIRVETLAGVRECFLIDTADPERFMVRVNMGRPSFLPTNIPVEFDDVMVIEEEFEVEDKEFLVSCVSLGNPHCVVDVESLENFEVAHYGPLIEKHPAFPKGVNVEFIEIKNDQVSQRTWERGSGETKACGTGACAVGMTLIMRKKLKSPVDIHLHGGDLRVEWDGLREAWLTGEAVSGPTGELEIT